MYNKQQSKPEACQIKTRLVNRLSVLDQQVFAVS